MRDEGLRRGAAGRAMMACWRPTAHMLTFLSSPPVTMTPADLRPMRRQLTVPACAGNSSADRTGVQF